MTGGATAVVGLGPPGAYAGPVLLLARHGQTAANAAGLLLGRADLALTELGHLQAKALAQHLASATRVVSSPLLRARETAAAFGLPVEVDERWVEMDYGTYDGQPMREVPAEVWARWRGDPGWAPPGGESLAAVERRVGEACGPLLEEAATADVVVVSHVSPIKAGVAWALGAGPAVSWRMHLDVASVCRIRPGPAGPVLVTFNEREHLAAVGSLP